MSTILKALRRVEGERSDDSPATGLREGVVAQGAPPSRDRRPLWQIGLAALLVLLLLGFFVWWLIPTDETAPPLARAEPAVAARARPAAPAPRLERRTARRKQTAAPGGARPAEPPPLSPRARTVAPQPPPASIERPALREGVAATPPPQAAAPPAGAPATRVPPTQVEKPAPWARIVEVPAPEAERSPPVPEPQTRTSPTPPEPAVAKAPPPSPPEPAVAKTPPPAPVAKVRPPAITVKKTIWHPAPERRVAQVEVEGREGPIRLHEGDAVGTLVVAEIKPSEVVFLHQGQELHRSVGGER